ncbi:hypothetical protein [Vibrio rotiferianus]|uniref:hypothetical protein n=1 Tax=Vibrio rotiferianus TaxID=190895 RepID=UPI002894FD69|nr:conserved hypothetical protein [Vibrio rotiferianus]
MQKNARLEIKAKSESINKWARRLEEEFEVEAQGATPTEKIESAIALIKSLLESAQSSGGTPNLTQDHIDAVDDLISEVYDLGSHVGFAKALEHVQKGKIRTKKIRNEESWCLMCSSREYQITRPLPTLDGRSRKQTTYINLAEHGFVKVD